MSEKQPMPTTGAHSVDVLPLVLIDLVDRGGDGLRKYGKPLQTHNGRNAITDAYQEAQDMTLYLKQAEIERAEMVAAIVDRDAKIASIESELRRMKSDEARRHARMGGAA